MGPSYANLFVGFIENQFFQSIQRSQTRTKRSLHEQLYRRYLSSREELTQFITTVKSFHLVPKDTWEISDTSLASLGIKNFNLKQHSMHYSVYYKPTDSCYLSYSSSHPSHVRTSIPFFVVIQALSFMWLSCFCRSSGPPPSQKIDGQSAPQTTQEENADHIPFIHPHNHAVKSIIL